MLKLARQSAFISFLSFLTCLTLLDQALAANEVFLSNDTAQFEATWVIKFVTSVKGTTDTIRITLPPDSNAANAALGRVVIGASVFESNNDVQMSVDPLDPNSLMVHLTVPFNLKAGTQILIELFNLMNPVSGNYAIAASTIDQRGNVLETVAIGFTTFDTGDITAVNAGAGLAGGGTTGDVTLSVANSYQLPQGCASGQVAKSNGAGGWTCAGDNNSGGTVTSVDTGPGLIGGPILTTGTVSVATGGITSTMIAPNAVDSSKILDGSIGSTDVNSAQIQLRVTPGCSAGSAIRVVNPDGTVACEPAGISGSGTANVLAKFTDTTAIGNSSIFESGGAVSLGAALSNANNRLQINNTPVASTSAALLMLGTSNLSGGQAGGTYIGANAPVNSTDHVDFIHYELAGSPRFQVRQFPASGITTVGINGADSGQALLNLKSTRPGISFQHTNGTHAWNLLTGDTVWEIRSTGSIGTTTPFSIFVEDHFFAGATQFTPGPEGAAHPTAFISDRRLTVSANTVLGWTTANDSTNWNDSPPDVRLSRGGANLLDVSSDMLVHGGLILSTTATQPTCDESHRGAFWVTQGGTGVQDKVEVCAKDAADAYAWRTIY